MAEFSRGRVAFTVPSARLNCPTDVDNTWHLGHARSLYLGATHCANNGIPFDLRLDGFRVHEGDSAGAIVDLHNLLTFLRIVPRRMYWHPQGKPNPEVIRKALGKRAEGFLTALDMPCICPDWYEGVLCDDIIDNDPSLIIRGEEFGDPVKWCADHDTGSSMKAHVAFERMLYAMAGREMHELLLPIVTKNGYKLSKSTGNVPHWTVLTMGGYEKAKGFLERPGTWEWCWTEWMDWLE